MTHHRSLPIMLMLLLPLVMFSAIAGCSNEQNFSTFGYTVKIGAQPDTEQQLIAEMYRALIEDRTHLKAEVIPDLDSPEMIGAFLNNEIQIATFYNGNFTSRSAAVNMLNPDSDVLIQAQASSVGAYQFRWLTPLDYHVRYAIWVERQRAEQEGWKRISDLRNAESPLSLAVDRSWLQKQGAGYEALQEQYGIDFSPMFAADTKGVYEALLSGKADLILVDQHDLRNRELDLVPLEDDCGFFPLYHPVPAVKSETYRDYAEIAPALALLEGHLDPDTIARLKYEVEVKGVRVKSVAETFLMEEGLLKQQPGIGHKG